ncbi:MAG: sensor histidine kinase [Rhodospirillales bacterium CG15_BIG_FIL_POST_REV_8_21_14_020_66_15]|nr:MAG: sensor histidine kinase [Rhodospirillales bacterium CG15_BIG_FIL_POST_REV_8_21_14_020_66_15]
MTGRSWSLRSRLIAWLLLPLSLLAAAMVAAAYFNAVYSANRAYDRILLASALAIAERVVLEDGDLDVDLPYVALEMLSSSTQDRVFYQVIDGKGGIVTGYRGIPNLAGVVTNEPVFFNAAYRGFDVRVAELTRTARGRQGNEQFTVRVAQTTSERRRLVREIVTGAIIGLVIVLALVGIITWVGITWGLAPLGSLRSAILNRSSEDLRPLATNVPREVDSLVASINSLMARLDESLQTMRRFIADASHQLKSPLAGLRTQTEVILKHSKPEDDRGPYLELRQLILRASHLVDQLLTMARAEPGGGGYAKEPVDFEKLAKNVTMAWVPRALEKAVDLGFEGGTRGAVVRGDPTLLEEMLANLIDNAIIYSPENSDVTVNLGAPWNDQVVIRVEDAGKGIPESERGRVFDRFYRPAGSPAGGCGLGLAIVREIAEQHGGAVRLLDGKNGKGTSVEIRLPCISAAGRPDILQ